VLAGDKAIGVWQRYYPAAVATGRDAWPGWHYFSGAKLPLGKLVPGKVSLLFSVFSLFCLPVASFMFRQPIEPILVGR